MKATIEQNCAKDHPNKVDELKEAIGLLPLYLEKIKDSASRAASYVEAQSVSDVSYEIAKLSDMLQNMISIFSQIKRETNSLIRASRENMPQQSFHFESPLGDKTAKIHLLSILKGIKAAHASNDTLMLVDLLEYELKDNLTQWKIRVFPQIKQLIQLASH